MQQLPDESQTPPGQLAPGSGGVAHCPDWQAFLLQVPAPEHTAQVAPPVPQAVSAPPIMQKVPSQQPVQQLPL